MSSGGARRNAGRPAKSLQQHLLSNTYRRDRHGPLPVRLPDAHEQQSSRRPAAVVEPPAHALDGLGVDGLRFVRAAFTDAAVTDFEWTALEVEILRLAAQALDDDARARACDDLKAARAAARQF